MTQNWPNLSKKYVYLYKHHIRIGPSLHLTVILLSIHLATLIFLWTVLFYQEIANPLNYLAQLICFISGYHSLGYHCLLFSKKAIIRIEKTNIANHWWLILKNGNQLTATLKGTSLLTASLIILNFSIQKHIFPRSIVLCKDSLNNDEWQRLRVYLGFLPATFWQSNQPISNKK